MKNNILPLIALLVLSAGCSTAYRQTQTPDDVYFSPGKTQEYADARPTDRYRDDGNRNDEYQDYSSSSNDDYLRMKIQNRYQWSTLDDNAYWNSPGYAYNNFSGFNSFNPYSLNSWGLSYYYSPFASIQPYSWFNSYYPSYGFGYGFSPNYGGYYGHNYSNGYYGYVPSGVAVNTSRRTPTSRPLLGGYSNNRYSNSNRRSAVGDRYIPANNQNSRYNNTNNTNNNSLRYNNNNTQRANNTNTNTNTYTPSRSYTPSTSGGSSSGGTTVTRPVRR